MSTIVKNKQGQIINPTFKTVNADGALPADTGFIFVSRHCGKYNNTCDGKLAPDGTKLGSVTTEGKKEVKEVYKKRLNELVKAAEQKGQKLQIAIFCSDTVWLDEPGNGMRAAETAKVVADVITEAAKTNKNIEIINPFSVITDRNILPVPEERKQKMEAEAQKSYNGTVFYADKRSKAGADIYGTVLAEGYQEKIGVVSLLREGIPIWIQNQPLGAKVKAKVKNQYFSTLERKGVLPPKSREDALQRINETSAINVANDLSRAVNAVGEYALNRKDNTIFTAFMITHGETLVPFENVFAHEHTILSDGKGNLLNPKRIKVGLVGSNQGIVIPVEANKAVFELGFNPAQAPSTIAQKKIEECVMSQ